MTADDYISFLKTHKPMPSDVDITEDEADVFVDALRHFQKYPDKRCVPLFIKSVSKETGLGMYEHIKFVLMCHDAEIVIQHLREALGSDNPGVLYRCCLWATDVDRWELAELIEPLVYYTDEDVRVAANNFLELRDELC